MGGDDLLGPGLIIGLVTGGGAICGGRGRGWRGGNLLQRGAGNVKGGGGGGLALEAAFDLTGKAQAGFGEGMEEGDLFAEMIETVGEAETQLAIVGAEFGFAGQGLGEEGVGVLDLGSEGFLEAGIFDLGLGQGGAIFEDLGMEGVLEAGAFDVGLGQAGVGLLDLEVEGFLEVGALGLLLGEAGVELVVLLLQVGDAGFIVSDVAF